MIKIEDWQIVDFANMANYNKLRKEVDGFLFYNMEKEAYFLYLTMNKKKELLNQLDGESLKKSYFDLLNVLRLIALPRLGDAEVLYLVGHNIVKALEFNQEDLDIRYKVNSKLSYMPLADRDKYKMMLVKVLEENKEVVTQKDLIIDGQSVQGTVANWFLDYRKFRADRKIDDKLVKAEYLYKNKNIISLDDKDKQKIKILLNLYEQWHKSSYTVEGREDSIIYKDGDKLYGVYGGEVFEISGRGGGGDVVAKEEIKKIEKSIVDETANNLTVGEADVPAKVMQKRVIEDSQKRLAQEILQKEFNEFIQQEMVQRALEAKDKLQLESEKQLKKIRNQFYHSINKSDKIGALGALFAMAENGQLRAAFGADERFYKFWAGYLEKNGLDVAEFKKDPAGKKYLAMFFEYVLEKRLAIPNREVVLIGVMIANLSLGSGELAYKTIAYGDLEDKKFKWNF